jgi:hypothetical protein
MNLFGTQVDYVSKANENARISTAQAFGNIRTELAGAMQLCRLTLTNEQMQTIVNLLVEVSQVKYFQARCLLSFRRCARTLLLSFERRLSGGIGNKVREDRGETNVGIIS